MNSPSFILKAWGSNHKQVDYGMGHGCVITMLGESYSAYRHTNELIMNREGVAARCHERLVG